MLLLNTRGYKHPIIPRSTGHPFSRTNNSKTEGTTLFRSHYTKENMEQPLCVHPYSHPTLHTQRWHLEHTTQHPSSNQDAARTQPPRCSLLLVWLQAVPFLISLGESWLYHYPAPHPSICTTNLYTEGRRKRHFFQWLLLSRGVSRAHTQPNHRYQ